jgi:hypothetical protein
LKTTAQYIRDLLVNCAVECTRILSEEDAARLWLASEVTPCLSSSRSCSPSRRHQRQRKKHYRAGPC